jgi:pyruvate formate lyase activating enzyme
MTLNEARDRLETLLPYLRQGGGGVTVSGGEPSRQPEFVQALFKAAHELGLNTVLDTNGACAPARRHDLLAVTDIVLMDIKAMDEKLHLKLTGCCLGPVLIFGRLAAEVPGRLTIRRILLPGINDSARELESLADYALGLPNIPEIELIAYHRLGVHKWKELGMRYSLAKLAPPKPSEWGRAAERLRKRGLVVHQG